MKYLISIVILFITLSASSQTVYNVRDFGAKGDGETLDTEAINAAIEKASQAGGGTIFFPSGTYVSFSIRLRSNITLLLDNGSKVLAADTLKYGFGFDHAEPNQFNNYQDYGHSHWRNSLIWGEDLTNVAIIGQGMIDGTNGLTRSGRKTKGIANKAIALKNCRNVTIKDISMLMCGHFALLATGVDQLTLDNIKVDTNRDAFDIDCCQHVRISNCSVNSPWDDAICLKSSYALGYARATEDVTITNCYVSGFDRGTFLDGSYQKKEAHTVPDKGVVTGRIKFGTESNGGFKNITISNCTFEFCRGLALETVDGGILEDVTISNMVMKDIQGAPFFFRLGARMRAPEDTPVGKLRRINISNVIVYSENPDYCSMIMGIPNHPVEDITMSNITIRIKGGAPIEQANLKVEEHETSYPDPQEFGKMPAYGFFIRHANNIKLQDINILLENKDNRPAMIINDAENLTLKNISFPIIEDTGIIKIDESSSVSIDNCNGLKNSSWKNSKVMDQ